MSKEIRKLINHFNTFNNIKLNESKEKPKKVIIRDGAYVGGYTSNGEHYVLLYDDKWELYTGYDKLLTSGKIKSQIDYDYIVNLRKDS
jgi:hypothetical protein